MFKIKKFISTALCLLIFGCFFTPIPAHAASLIGLGSQDATAAINLAPYISPVMKYLFDTMVGLLKGLVFLIASAWLLQAAVDYTPQWINLDSTFVKIGLQFTTTMADILLIAVFVAIAIGYVFKMETFNSEKALPKFFITALLVHFAPLFVGMMIDVANILMKSVMIGKEGLFTSVFVMGFGKDIMLSIASIATPFLIMAGASIVGSLGTLGNLGVVTLVMANLFIGVPHFIMQNMVLDILGGLVFGYAMFFFTRIFIMQLLAVLSPLAILSAALPQTKKWYQMWMEWLTGWSLGGILMLFLLTLGLTCMDMLSSIPSQPATLSASGQIINWVMGWQFYWFAIAIYMMTVDAICLAAIPSLAKQFTQKMEGGVRQMGKTIGSAAEKKLRTGFSERTDVGVKQEKTIKTST